MTDAPTWDQIDDLLQTIQRHQARRDDVELLAQARSDLAVLRYTTTVKTLQQSYSRGRA